MLDKIKNYVIAGFTIIIIGLFLWQDYQSSKNEKEQLDLRNTVARKDTLIREKDSSFSRLSLEFNSQKDLNNILQTENKSLADQVKKDGEKIKSLIAAGVHSDTVYIDSSKIIYTTNNGIEHFTAYEKPFRIEGDYSLDSATENRIRNLNVKMDDFKIIALETKLESGFFKARVKLVDNNGVALPYFSVYNIESAISSDDNSTVRDYFAIGLGARLSSNTLDFGALIKIGEKNYFTLDYKIIDSNVKLTDLSWYNRLVAGYYRLLW